MPKTRTGKESSSLKTVNVNEDKQDLRAVSTESLAAAIMDTTVANVNNNHSGKSKKLGKQKTDKVKSDKNGNHSIERKRRRRSSSHIDNDLLNQNNSFAEGDSQDSEFDKNYAEHANFEEDGEMIQMEINDGGAAEQEFASELSSDSESEEENEQELEAGEITEGSASEDEEPEQPAEKRIKKKSSSNKSTKSTARVSVEARLDTLTDTLSVMKDFMLQNRIMTRPLNHPEGKNQKDKDGTKRKGQLTNPSQTNSDTTIYKNVLSKIGEPENQAKGNEVSDLNSGEDEDDPEVTFKVRDERHPNTGVRDGSSLDEKIDTSDEMMEMDVDINERFIADCVKEVRHRSAESHPYAKEGNEGSHPENREHQADKIIREAEAHRAVMYGAKGNVDLNWNQHASFIDGDYVVIGTHVDQVIQEKIRRGVYVDFSQLLPRDRSSHSNDEQRMELISRGGMSYFVPISDRENGITNFNRWEQAFRIFMNVYT